MTTVLSDIVEVAAIYFWRMVAVFFLVTGVVAFVLLSKADVFEAQTFVLYKLGRDYIYVPDAAESGARAPDPGDLQLAVNAEMQILNSARLKRALLERLGIETIFPDIGTGPQAQRRALNKLKSAIGIGLISGSYVVELSVRHTDPEIAAKIATTLFELYLVRRTEIFAAEDVFYLREQLAAAERQAAEIEQGIEILLDGNDILSYATERDSIIAEQSNLRPELTGLDATIAALAEKKALIIAELEKVAPMMRAATNPLYRQAETEFFLVRLALAENASKRNFVIDRLRENGEKIAIYADTTSVLELSREKLQSQREQVARIYSRLQDREAIESLDAEARTNIRVIEPATPPVAPIGVPKSVRLIVAAFLGGSVSFGWVLIAFFSHQSMISSSMARHRLDLPVLGEIERRMRAGRRTSITS